LGLVIQKVSFLFLLLGADDTGGELFPNIHTTPVCDDYVAEEQSPIFIQFLDCCWQLLRQYPTHFEFNAKMLETIADSVFSARFGTLLGNCERERNMWDITTRSPSLWTFLLANKASYRNPFYRATNTKRALIPPSSSVLRHVTLWTEYYFRGAAKPSFPQGDDVPPCYAPHHLERARTCFDDMSESLAAALEKIAHLEQELRVEKARNFQANVFTAQAAPRAESQPAPAPTPIATFVAPASHTPLFPTANPTMGPPSVATLSGGAPSTAPAPAPAPTPVPLPSSLAPSQPTLVLAPTPTLGMSMSQQSASTWICSICSKQNPTGSLKCAVCGRVPK
jgi:hypothetical protein